LVNRLYYEKNAEFSKLEMSFIGGIKRFIDEIDPHAYSSKEKIFFHEIKVKYYEFQERFVNEKNAEFSE
jgi:hypothetical protein